MDQVLSALLPTYKIGNDGFSWWIGQVENNKEEFKKSSRVQVRIVGQHNREGDITPTTELPWAHVMMPVNVPYSDGGTTGATNNLQIGAWVMGFYLDVECQKPMVIGSIAHTPASTYKDLQDYTPNLKSLGFKPTRAVGVNATIHRQANEQGGKNSKGAVTEGGPPAIANANVPRAVCPAVGALKGKESDMNPIGGQMCVEVADPNCESKSLGNNVKTIIGELLASTQVSGGNIGDYYVSKINGELYSAIDIPRAYITKLNRVITGFGTRIKSEIIFAIRNAIEELVELVMGVQSATDLAKQSGDKALNPKESYVPVTERGYFIKKVIDTFNKILNEIGCSFKKTLDDLIKYIIDLLMKYLMEAFSAAFCLIDNIVDTIVRYIDSAFSTLVETVLGPIQALLGEAGNFANIIGGVINKVLTLLGISCTGVPNKCNKDKTRCTNGGSDDKKKEEKDFLDKLIDEIENGSLTGESLNGYGTYSRGVCDAAKTYGATPETNVKLIGGVSKSSPARSYVSKTTIIPNIPIETINFPNTEDLPSALTDFRRDRDPFIEYKITAREKKIKSGETAIFDILGPERNGVIEVEVLSYTTGIVQEEPYEECIVNSNDGLSVGFTVLPVRGVNSEGDEIVDIQILSPGKGYLVGMEFTISGSKVGGENGVDDVTFRITVVGERINYKIFGDIYQKNLVSSGTYPEYGEFLYTEPRSFSISTNQLFNWDAPGYVGLEFTSKRAADSTVIWDEDPEDTFSQEIPTLKLVSLNSDKDRYVEGESIEYRVETTGYIDGTIFQYKIFGDVGASDYATSDENNKVLVSSSLGEFFIFILEDEDKSESIESLTVLLFEDGSDKPLASKTVFIEGQQLDEDTQPDPPFTLSLDTTQKDLDDYLDTQDLIDEKDFGNDKPDLPPDLQPEDPEDPEDEDPTGPPSPPEPPEPGIPVTDPDGSIINIPIDTPGGRQYQVPPKVVIEGNGSGAAGIALLDRNGFVSEIRVTRIGSGYKRNVPGVNNDLTCVIDSFTIIRPGFGYKEPPTLYIDGDPSIAQIKIDDNGFIVGTEVLNRSKSFNTIPDVLIVGGGGAGGFVLPSLVCLPQEELEQQGYVKIGTGSYIDCP